MTMPVCYHREDDRGSLGDCHTGQPEEVVMAENRKDGKHGCSHGISRRGFISTVGAGTLGAAVVRGADATASGEPQKAGELSRITLSVNGRSHALLVESRWSLAYVLRERLGLTGTKVGCDRGECGACTVLIDGIARYSCMTLAVEAQAHEITTVEGLMRGEELGDVQQAFAQEDALQCGYCTPGQIMAAEGLLRTTPNPSAHEIRAGMSGNLCRCGTYVHIFRAVKRVAVHRAKGGAS
jgi:xanthine dehydrogenase YagT iron-sulfur-binding subunit